MENLDHPLALQGIVDDMASSPLSYAIYGKFTPIVKGDEFRSASSKLRYDTNCGAPAWKGAADSNHFSHNIDPQSLTPTQVREYGRLIQVVIPHGLLEENIPRSVLFKILLKKGLILITMIPSLSSLRNLWHLAKPAAPTENEIKLAKKVKKEADIGIENALVNTSRCL